VIASFMGLTCSKLSDNIGWIGTSLSIVVSAYVADGRVCIDGLINCPIIPK
jgi:hypothetical protein